MIQLTCIRQQYPLLCQYGLSREITRNSSSFCSFKYAKIVCGVIKAMKYSALFCKVFPFTKKQVFACLLVLCQNESWNWQLTTITVNRTKGHFKNCMTCRKPFDIYSQAVWRHNGQYTGLSDLFVSSTRSVKLSTLSILTSENSSLFQSTELYR